MENIKPKLIVFASGSKDGGGSGFKKLVENQKTGVLNAEIVAVVSNHANGGVKEIAEEHNVKFIHFNGPYVAEEYQRILSETGAEWVALSGWLKLALGLDPSKTINIHPAPLPAFGGKGMYGHYAHEAVMEAYKRGEIKHSAVTMHFVTPVYDEGPAFFRYKVEITTDDTPETLGSRVNAAEHEWQSKVTSMVVNGEISWDGEHKESLKVPEGWNYL